MYPMNRGSHHFSSVDKIVASDRVQQPAARPAPSDFCTVIARVPWVCGPSRLAMPRRVKNLATSGVTEVYCVAAYVHALASFVPSVHTTNTQITVGEGPPL
ncbi:hypothetical protein VTK56DRAFT_1460 [Thermocarpiscus australiensis]